MSLIKAVSDFENHEIVVDSTKPPIEQICAYWPVIVMALKIVKFFSGAKGDAIIDQVLEWGKGICEEAQG